MRLLILIWLIAGGYNHGINTTWPTHLWPQAPASLGQGYRSGKWTHPTPPIRIRKRVASTSVATQQATPQYSSGSESSTGAPDWGAIAFCESRNHWHEADGNGYYGGLQISPVTWAGVGGLAIAPLPSEATVAEQIEIAERILAEQGAGAWPNCYTSQ